MNEYAIIIYPLVFIYGIVVGSFLNVCIYRIPRHETIVTTPSHCMSCGYELRWYDLIPVFSWLGLRGKCRKCKAPVSVQYPLVELINGLFWLWTIYRCGLTAEGILYCLFVSALLVLGVIDFRTYEIPFGINIFIALLGVVRVCTDAKQWFLYVIGLFLVSGIFGLVFVLTKGNGMGGGDIKLMAAAGLLLGGPKVFLAMLIGCVLAVIIHPLRMKLSKEGHRLAFGPYLAAGCMLSAWFGNEIIAFYLAMW